MSFWDSIDLLNLLNTWLLIIVIVVSFVWGLLMIRWESKKVKSLKKRIIFTVIVAAIWGTVLLIIGSRIDTLNDIEKKELKNSVKLNKDNAIEFENKLSESESLRVLSEQKLEKQLQSTNKELEDTKKKIEPRIISNEQIDKFVNYLSHYPKGEIILETRARSVEVQNYVKQLRNLLTKAGFDIKQTSSLIFGAEPVGIILVVKSQRTKPAFTAPLQKAFYFIGIDAPAKLNNNKPANTLTIIIGHKP